MDSELKFHKSLCGFPPVEKGKIPYDLIIDTLKRWSPKFTKFQTQMSQYGELFDLIQWVKEGLRESIEDQMDTMNNMDIRYGPHPTETTPTLHEWRVFVKKIDDDFNEEQIYVGSVTESNLRLMLKSTTNFFRVKEVFYSEQGVFDAWSNGCDIWSYPNKPYVGCTYLTLDELPHRIEALP